MTSRSRRECSYSVMPPDKLRSLALDLNQTAPRSPYAPLGASFPAVAARLVDKCRAELLGRAGSYHYNCPMDRRFFAATGLEPAALRDFISTGADDVEVASWMRAHTKAPPGKIAPGVAASARIPSGGCLSSRTGCTKCGSVAGGTEWIRWF